MSLTSQMSLLLSINGALSYHLELKKSGASPFHLFFYKKQKDEGDCLWLSTPNVVLHMKDY